MPLSSGAGSPSNTMWPGPRSTSVSSSIFISVVTVSKCFLSVGFGRFCRKNLGFRFGLGFHD